MKLEQLEQLILIEEYGSLTKTAKALYTSHSTISNNLSNLEQEIGLRLFDRTSNGLLPTNDGKEIIQIARTVLQSCNQILNYGKEKSSLSGMVTVYVAPAFQKYYSEIIADFQKAFPEAVLCLNVCSLKTMIADIQNGKGNIGITLFPEFMTQKQFSELKIETYGMCATKIYASRGHALFQRNDVNLQDLWNEQFVFFDKEQYENYRLNDRMEILPLIMNDLESMKQLVQSGKAVAPFPEIFIQENELLVPVSVVDAEQLPIFYYGLMFHGKRKLTLLENKTIEYLGRFLRQRL